MAEHVQDLQGTEELIYQQMDFRAAGQESYVLPPIQNPLKFERLENVLPVTQGPFFRRWGYSQWSATGMSDVQRLYEYHNNNTQGRQIIAISPVSLRAYNEDGAVYRTTILSPINSQGFNNGATAVNDSITGTVAWTNPSDALTANDVRATVSVIATSPITNSQWLKITNFSFTGIPFDAKIVGIEVEIEHNKLGSTAGAGAVLQLAPVVNGIVQTNALSFLPVPPTPQIPPPIDDLTIIAGGPSDPLGQTLVGANIDANFGVALQQGAVGGPADTFQWNVDSVRVRVYWSTAPDPAVAGRGVTSRDYFFFTNGTTEFLKKWDGSSTAGVTNWGIATLSASPQTMFPDTGANDALSGTVAWTTPGNVTASDDARATVALTNQTSQWLKITDFDFTVPTNATVLGIKATVEMHRVGSGSAPSQSTGTVTIAGDLASAEFDPCADQIPPIGEPPPSCPITIWDSGEVYIEVNGNRKTVGYGLAPGNDTPTAVAIALDVAINGDAGYPVTSSRSGAVLTLTSKETGTHTNYTLVAASQTSNPGTFGGPSFTATTSGTSMTGGAGGGSFVAALVRAGTIQTATQRTIDFASIPLTTDGTVVVGHAEDLFGTFWTPADVNNVGFGIAFQGQTVGADNTVDFKIDAVQITLFLSNRIEVGAPTAGDVTLQIGRKYNFVLVNSSTGHMSDLHDFSVSTGPVTSKQIPLSNLPSSVSDTQVDRIFVLATADGGDEQRLFLLADLPIGTTTLNDNIPEVELILREVFLDVDEFGDEHGVTFNTPPPPGTMVVRHGSRLWMAGVPDQPGTIFYSKDLSDLITSTGNIAGRYEEAWPQDNFIDISPDADRITALLSDGTTLYVSTERRIYRILGNPPGVLLPEIVFGQIGATNQEVIKPVFVQGNPAGVVFLSRDRRVIQSDLNTYRDIGYPIQDILDDLPDSALETAHATYFSSGGNDWYSLAVRTSDSPVTVKFLLLDLETQAWVIWTIPDVALAQLGFITESGKSEWIFSESTNSKIHRFAAGATRDREAQTPNISQAFTATVQTTWLGFGMPNVTKVLNKLKLLSGDPNLKITVEMAQTNADFTSPITVVSSVVPSFNQLGDKEIALAGASSRKRWSRLKFVSDVTPDLGTPILSYYELFFVPYHVF